MTEIWKKISKELPPLFYHDDGYYSSGDILILCSFTPEVGGGEMAGFNISNGIYIGNIDIQPDENGAHESIIFLGNCIENEMLKFNSLCLNYLYWKQIENKELN